MDGPRVAVLALFRRGQLEPKAFNWQGRTVPLQRVTLRYRTKEDGPDRWYFTVVSAGGLHTLEYEPGQCIWRLVASWVGDEQSMITT